MEICKEIIIEADEEVSACENNNKGLRKKLWKAIKSFNKKEQSNESLNIESIVDHEQLNLELEMIENEKDVLKCKVEIAKKIRKK